MQLAKRTSATDDRLVQVVDQPELPAAPGVERMFREIYARVLPHCMRHAETLLSKEEARDAVHNAMQRAWALWRGLTPEEMSDAYVYRAVHREIIVMSRRNDQMVDLDDAEAELAQHAIEDIDHFTRPTTAQAVHDAAIDAMPPRRRQVMLLIQRFHLTYEEVGEQLGMSIGTVNTHMRLANEQIRVAFTASGFRLDRSKGPGKGFVLTSGESGGRNV
jgi:RNA polymerase sigma factor (sigma-70 family)